MDPLKELNPQQQQAVAADTGQVLVLAGPGSGKTRVLTFRIAYLIHNLGVRPYNINAVTFTNKAAREMAKRVEELLDGAAEGLWVGTFHASCARILRRETDHLPFSSSYVIYDADDQVRLVKNILNELNVNDKLHPPHSVHAAISNAKNHLIQPKDYIQQTYRDAVVQRIYTRYQQLLTANDALDFDDLLMWTAILFAENPEVKKKYARRFEHILVDEFQDTNIAQYEIIKHLSSYHHNLFVVGDEDQSIYRWRGADYRNVLRFEQDFPGCQKILLEQNYRSKQIVLDAAQSVIDHNRNRTPKKLFTKRGQGEPIVLYEAPDDHSEAAYVVETIQNHLNKGSKKGGEFAIMYRTNAQSRLLEDAFMRAGMPYRLVGAQRFYGRREIKDLIAYLRLIHNPSDEISLDRIINVPARKIGNKTINTLKKVATQMDFTPGAVLLDLGKKLDKSIFLKQFSKREAGTLTGFGQLFAGWRAALNQIPLHELIERILMDTGFQAYLDSGSDEGLDRWANVEEFLRLALEFEERNLGLVDFLENLALVSDQDTLPEKLDAPTLLTLHAAKGLEFGQVFIVGLDDGLLPHTRSINSDDPEEMAEERRLFYVGITRTMNQLYFVRATRRTTYGSSYFSSPCRFIEDIPDDLIRLQGVRSFSSSSSGSWRQEAYQTQSCWESTSSPASAAVVTPQFSPNMRVNHPVWGEGLVLESRMDEGDEMVDVHFESVGFKRLLAALAKLEIIE